MADFTFSRRTSFPHIEQWCASKFLLDPVNEDHSTLPTIPAALVILNQPLCNKEAFGRIWRNTALHLCADGGANRLFDAFEGDEDRKRYIPDHICGDLDSLRPEVRDWYATQGTVITHLTDQDSTDLQKCINLLHSSLEPDDSPPSSPSTSTATSRLSRLFFPHCLGPDPNATSQPAAPRIEIVVLGSLGGRFDHIMSCIHTLFVVEPERKVYLVSHESIAVLLRPGSHEIICNRSVEGPTCGLIPVGVHVARVVTDGLKWNVDRSMPLSFGGLVSTSNAFVESDQSIAVVKVETDAPVVWTVEASLI